MKFILLLIGLSPFCLLAQDKMIVYDEMIEERSVGAFSEIQVEGGIDVYISQDPRQKVVVSASTEANRDLIITEVEGNKLKIHSAPTRRYNGENRKMKVYISSGELKRITASGASDIYIHGILKGKKMSIHLSGASDFAGAVQFEELAIAQSGSSDAKLSGAVNNFNAVVTGASDLKAYACKVDKLKAVASGASQIEITVEKEMDLVASGASDIYYKGKGVVIKQVSTGASSIKSVDK